MIYVAVIIITAVVIIMKVVVIIINVAVVIVNRVVVILNTTVIIVYYMSYHDICNGLSSYKLWLIFRQVMAISTSSTNCLHNVCFSKAEGVLVVGFI